MRLDHVIGASARGAIREFNFGATFVDTLLVGQQTDGASHSCGAHHCELITITIIIIIIIDDDRAAVAAAG